MANASTVIADAHSPLTQDGIEQARKTGEEVRGKGVVTIACSPYLRAQQTAEIIAGEIGIDTKHIVIVDELGERGLGVLENKHREHEGTWYFTDESSAEIEPGEELLQRMKASIHKIDDLSKNGLVLVAGHAISGFYLQQAVKNKQLKDFDSPSQMSNADFVVVEY